MIGSILLSAFFLAAGVWNAGAGDALEPSGYLFYVASESEDEVTLLRFSPGQGLVIERVIHVGRLPAEIEAPHGIFLDPDGSHWYLTLGHGLPFGSLWKYETGSDTAVAQVELGMFPATVAVAPFGGLALTVNSDFHGDMVPSTVSIVELESMIEIDRTETCTMPHGSRFSSDGLRHYSACMMDDELVEIDVTSLDVSRRLNLVSGELVVHAGAPAGLIIRKHARRLGRRLPRRGRSSMWRAIGRIRSWKSTRPPSRLRGASIRRRGRTTWPSPRTGSAWPRRRRAAAR